MPASSDPEELAARVTGRQRRTLILLVLVVTLALGSAAPSVQTSTSLDEFRGGTEAAAADNYIEREMSSSAAGVTQGLVVIRGKDNVLTRAGYLAQLQAQRALLANSTVNRTLHPAQRPLSLANVVAIVAIRREEGVRPENITVEPRPPLSAQIQAIKDLTPYEREQYTSYAIGVVLDGPSHTWPPGGGFAFVPTTYEANQKTAAATTIVVSYRESASPRELTRAQIATEAVVNRKLQGTNTSAFVLGNGMINNELRQSSRDSLVIVGPVALLFMLAILSYAYRDPLDVLLGLLGVGMVLTWTFGYMGWADITFNQLFVAVPVLLMGLSVDYAIHLTMRYREEREFETDDGTGPARVRSAMTVALGGLGVALALVTATTATGFLSNLVSGVAPIREFGVVSAVGIVAAFVVFAGFLPALKVELDAFLEARGGDRRRAPFGSEGGRLTRTLAGPIAAARVAPWGVLALAGILTLAGIGGAMTVSTQFEQEDLLVKETPAWTQNLPPAMQPANYTVQRNLNYVERKELIYDGTLAEVLIRGDVTRPGTLDRLQRAMNRVNRTDVVLILPNKQPATRSTITLMNQVADDNESFARVLRRYDTDGDGVPDRRLERVYDAFYAAAPEAAPTMLARENGEYVALRMKVPVNATAGEAVVTAQIRNATAPIEGRGLEVIPTGQPIKNQAVAEQLLDTVVEALAVTMAVVLVLLAAGYRLTEGSATLGIVTLIPVLMAVAWIVGTMALLGIPFNVMTALITSFTIGIGVDYSIHVSERYIYELERQASAAEALKVSVLGTGGALLGSAVTDIAGVGVLAFAILVPLQQFGIITAITIAYSFIGSVVVLPSMLVIWTELFGPAETTPRTTPSE